MPPEQIASFNATFVSKNLELYTWDLWGAAYVLVGGCSDDCFEYFRNWVVGQGRHYYNAVKRNPLSLADGRLTSDDEIGHAESLAYTGQDAYLRSSGGRDLYEDYPESPSTIAGREPAGTAWDEDDVERLYPASLPSLPTRQATGIARPVPWAIGRLMMSRRAMSWRRYACGRLHPAMPRRPPETARVRTAHSVWPRFPDGIGYVQGRVCQVGVEPLTWIFDP